MAPKTATGSSGGGGSAHAQPRSESEVLSRFQELRQGISTLFSKLNDIEAEAAEHDLVIKQLEPMESTRRCYRMIGDVLVERTVGEALPAVRRNREGLGQVMKQLQAQLEVQQKALAEHQTRYKIRVGAGAGGDEEPSGNRKPGGGKDGGSSSSGAGVLI